MIRGGFVSFDIVGHTSQHSRTRQVRHVEAMNRIVAEALASGDPAPVWASGGDGGHVAFWHEGWAADAIRLIQELRLWSDAAEVLLRVTANVGQFTLLEIGRQVQVVGSGINMGGRLVAVGFSCGVLVTDEFARAVQAAGVAGVELEGPRALPLRDFGCVPVHLLSMPQHFDSDWGSSLMTDHDLLNAAVRYHDRWEVLYRAKRLMQFDPFDAGACQALLAVEGSLRSYYHLNTGRGDTRSARDYAELTLLLADHSLVDLVRSAELVVRQAGDQVTGPPPDAEAPPIGLVLKGGRLVSLSLASPTAAAEIVVEPGYLLRPADHCDGMAFAEATVLLALRAAARAGIEPRTR